MRSRSGRLVLIFAVTCAVCACGQQNLTTAQAKTHIGEQATVCGKAVGVHYAASSKGQPTFINLDKAYPNQVFTILIWGSDRPKFGNPEQEYSGKLLCVTGTITMFRDIPEIVAHDPGVVKPQQ